MVPAGEREQELRKVIRSLSQVSQVETREIRARIEQEGRLRNRGRRRREVENDELLRAKRTALPGLLSAHRLFESKDKKVESLKERYIDSQAYLRRADFEYKKIQLKKQDIAHKQRQQGHQHAPAIPAPATPAPAHLPTPTEPDADPFTTPNRHLPDQVDPNLIDRLKTTVHATHKEMRNLYDTHVRQVTSLPFRKRVPSEPKSDAASVASFSGGPEIKPTQSVILLSNERRPRKPVEELIRMSSFRSREQGCEPTAHEQELQAETEELIEAMQAGIEQGNKLKETLVLGQLKKLLYGDRRGRFIQDSTFRTRLKGDYSEQYMNVVQEQQSILTAFNGSCLNRRNLVEKFATILGTLRTHSSHHEHELVLS